VFTFKKERNGEVVQKKKKPKNYHQNSCSVESIVFVKIKLIRVRGVGH
jgi:hypothetical protein